MKLDVELIRREIAVVLHDWPELADDEILRADMINGETSAFEFLEQAVRILNDTRALRIGLSAIMEESRLRDDRYERREESMRSLIRKVMDAADLKKVELPEATLSIRPGQPRVIITDENLIPDILCKIERTPRKADIKELLKDGKPVQGAELSNAEPVLSVRVR